MALLRPVNKPVLNNLNLQEELYSDASFEIWWRRNKNNIEKEVLLLLQRKMYDYLTTQRKLFLQKTGDTLKLLQDKHNFTLKITTDSLYWSTRFVSSDMKLISQRKRSKHEKLEAIANRFHLQYKKGQVLLPSKEEIPFL